MCLQTLDPDVLIAVQPRIPLFLDILYFLSLSEASRARLGEIVRFNRLSLGISPEFPGLVLGEDNSVKLPLREL